MQLRPTAPWLAPISNKQSPLCKRWRHMEVIFGSISPNKTIIRPSKSFGSTSMYGPLRSLTEIQSPIFLSHQNRYFRVLRKTRPLLNGYLCPRKDITLRADNCRSRMIFIDSFQLKVFARQINKYIPLSNGSSCAVCRKLKCAFRTTGNANSTRLHDQVL